MIISLDDRDDAVMPDIMDVKAWKRKYELGVSKIAGGSSICCYQGCGADEERLTFDDKEFGWGR